MMTKMPKLSFKKQKKEAGLASVGKPTPDTDVKVNGKVVGYLAAPTWQSETNSWHIRIAVKADSSFRWVKFPARFPTEVEARKWLKRHFSELVKICKLYNLE